MRPPERVGSPPIDGRTHIKMFGQVWSEGRQGWRSFAPTTVRDVEAHSVGSPPTRLDTQWPSSDNEPLLTVDPPTQPVSGTLPTWVDSPRSQVNVPVRNVRPRLRLQSVPSLMRWRKIWRPAQCPQSQQVPGQSGVCCWWEAMHGGEEACCRNSGDQHRRPRFRGFVGHSHRSGSLS